MRNFLTSGALVLAAVAVADRPLAAQNRHELQMAAELRILQEQQQQLALAMAELSRSLTQITQAVGARIDQNTEAMRKGFADQAITLNGVAQDIGVLRAQAQDSNTRLLQLKDEIDALRRSLPSLLTQYSRPPAFVDPNAPLDPDAPAGDPSQVIAPPPFPPVDPPVSTAGLSPTRMFDTAFADYAAGQFALAVLGFEQFLRAFPNAEQADNAQLFIGDAEYQQRNFDAAIAAYNQVIQRYPTGDQVPWAYYKRGLAEQQLQRADMARASWEQVIKLHPDSQGAQLARQRLDGLSGAQ